MKTRDAHRALQFQEANPLPPGCGTDIENWRDLSDEQIDAAYGASVWIYAERWADRMELAMAQGEPLSACVERTSYEACTTMKEWASTGFQHGCAVGYLHHTWAYGEELRQWHNIRTQIRYEGERANATGGVLNPALMALREEPLS